MSTESDLAEKAANAVKQNSGNSVIEKAALLAMRGIGQVAAEATDPDEVANLLGNLLKINDAFPNEVTGSEKPLE